MTGKILLGIGIALVILGPVGIIGGIFGSFRAMDAPESAGIGNVIVGLEVAVAATALPLLGAVFILIGGLKISQDARKKREM